MTPAAEYPPQHAARLDVLEERTHNFEEALRRVESKLDTLQAWMLGAALSSATTLLMFVLTLLRK